MKRPESSKKVCASVYFLLFIFFFSEQRPGAWGNFITAWNIAKASLPRLNGVQWALSCYTNTARHAEVPSLALWGHRSAVSAAKEMQIGCVRSSLNDMPSSESNRDTGWSTPRCFALNRPTKRGGQRPNAPEWWRSTLTCSEHTRCPQSLSQGASGFCLCSRRTNILDLQGLWLSTLVLNAENLLIWEEQQS